MTQEPATVTPPPSPAGATLTLARGASGEIAGLRVRFVDTGFVESTEGCFQFHQLVVSEGARREEQTVRSGAVVSVMGRSLTVTGDADHVFVEAR